MDTLYGSRGGSTDNNQDALNLDTTEYLDVVVGSHSTATLESKQGPKLPIEIYCHCLEMITDKLAILYGGEKWDDAPLANSWTFDLDISTNPNQTWVERTSMSASRRSHSCGVLRDAASPEERKIVVAAGGCGYKHGWSGMPLDSVELLHISGPVIALRWTSGPTMPVPTLRMELVCSL